MESNFFLVPAAFLVGTLVGLTGIGGGAVMTPALILFFGVPATVAIATDLVFATVTKLTASIIHSRVGSISWRVARKMWAGSIPGTLLGIALFTGLGREFIGTFTLMLCAVLLLTALSMVRTFGRPRRPSRPVALMGGGFLGFAVATTSVGAGALGVPLLTRLLGDSEPQKIVGTDIAHAIPIAFLAGISYGFSGFIDVDLLTTLLVGAVPGVIVGSFRSSKVDTQVLRRFIAVMLVIAALSLGLNALGIL